MMWLDICVVVGPGVGELLEIAHKGVDDNDDRIWNGRITLDVVLGYLRVCVVPGCYSGEWLGRLSSEVCSRCLIREFA